MDDHRNDCEEPRSSKAPSSALPEANKPRGNESPSMFNEADGWTGHGTRKLDLLQWKESSEAERQEQEAKKKRWKNGLYWKEKEYMFTLNF